MKKIAITILSAVLAVSTVLISACEPPKIKYLDFHEFVFGIGAQQISLNATLYGTNQKKLLKAKDEIINTLKSLNKELNTIDKNSVIWEFNNYGIEEFNPEKKFYVSEHVYHMLSTVEGLHKDKEGKGNIIIDGEELNALRLFDPTIYPLMELWGLGADKIHDKDSDDREIPTTEKIDEILDYVDFLSNVQIGEDEEGYYIKKSRKEVKIDFGGQAKGYGADLAVKICEKYNLKGAIIDIGGNVYLYKSKPMADGSVQKFTVVINKPDPKPTPILPKKYFCALRAENISLVTSGDYNRYFEKNNVKYAHIINPLTGLPVNIERQENGEDNHKEDGLTSVTIIHTSSELADIYATIVMLLGMEEGIEFMKKNSLTGVLMSHNKKYAAVGEIEQFDHDLANVYKEYEPYQEKYSF
jgi:thiamine biosynthesis lipoprotein